MQNEDLGASLKEAKYSKQQGPSQAQRTTSKLTPNVAMLLVTSSVNDILVAI